MLRKCKICGKYFHTKFNSLTCSTACRKIYYRNYKREQGRIRRKNNAEHIREVNRLSYSRHIEKRRAEKKIYYRTNTEKCKLASWRSREKRRIRERLEGGKTYCAVCGKYFQEEYHGQKYCSEKCRNNFSAKNMRRFFTKIFNKMMGD